MSKKKKGSSKGPHMTLRGDMMGECKPLPILSTRMAKIPKTNTHLIQKTILVKQLVLSFSVLNLHQKAGPLLLDFCQEEEQNPRLQSG